MSFVGSVANTISLFFSTSQWWLDVLDILLVTVLIYQFIRLIQRTRAVQLIKGIALVVVVYLIAGVLKLKTVSYIFQNLLQIGLLAIIVVFQPELRRALEQMGRGGFFPKRTDSERISMWHGVIVAICDSVHRMAETKTGALIVIARETGLNEIVGTGAVINSAVTSDLIDTIFYAGTPLHDGAIIIDNGRIIAAGCLLPLTANIEISRSLGTRHRAALGMSEVSDALVIVVSEETGIVSMAHNGILIRKLDGNNLFSILSNELMVGPNDNESVKSIRRFFKR
ncbi:MAG: diadenylate cyclase CdaA [Oscillospiraceae bacterium]|nr:diadenylate cyclase CdaA [Oscillospiraceae bacterium]